VDNLTHSLVGAALARSGLDRTTPLAAATLIVAANAPDVDVLAYTQGEWFALASRRGITHGVPALVVLPFLVGATMAGWDRLVRRRRTPDAPPARFSALLLLSFIGVLTHPVLDWMNTYGMRWWLPFDGSWSYGDALFIIDPWIWLMLGSAAALGARRARLGAAGWAALGVATSLLMLGAPQLPTASRLLWVIGIGVVVVARWRWRPEPDHARAVARVLTAATTVYILAMIGLSRRAEADVRQAIAAANLQGVRAVMIQPLPANPFASEVVIQTFDRYYQGSHRWRREPRVSLVDRPAVPRLGGDEPDPSIRAARLHPDIAHYLTWSRFPYWYVEPLESGGRVRVGDARYVERTGGLSGLTVAVP